MSELARPGAAAVEEDTGNQLLSLLLANSLRMMRLPDIEPSAADVARL